MADYFVKTTGNDANNGTTWALAKATVQAGVNLCTTAGDRCIIAPGVYFQTGVTFPSAGTRAAQKWIIGDYDSTIQDGGANTSGVTAGYVRLDASLQTGNLGVNNIGFFSVAASDNWAFWNWKGLWLTGGTGLFMASATSPAWDSTSFDQMIIECLNSNATSIGIALGLENWGCNPDTYAPITIKNSILISRTLNSTTSYVYNNALYLNSVTNGSTYTTAPQIIIDRCLLISNGYGLHIIAETASKCFVRIYNSLVEVPWQDSVMTPYAFVGRVNSGDYRKIETFDCLIRGANISSMNGGTYTPTRPMNYLQSAVASTIASNPNLPGVPYLFPGSSAIDVAGTLSNQATDIWGTTQQGANWDVGFQELKTNRYQKEPNMIPGTHDIPDIGNVTEDDTSDGATGTYHEATTAEVQSGVTFGANSGLTGTYTAGGGRPEFRESNL